MENNPIEVCVVCGKDTNYKFNDHIDYRFHYIEGAGQLCKDCYDKGTDRNHILVPESIIYNTPNNQELGAKVRQLYWESKN